MRRRERTPGLDREHALFGFLGVRDVMSMLGWVAVVGAGVLCCVLYVCDTSVRPLWWLVLFADGGVVGCPACPRGYSRRRVPLVFLQVCLKYVVLANMLALSDINPFAAREAKV